MNFLQNDAHILLDQTIKFVLQAQKFLVEHPFIVLVLMTVPFVLVAALRRAYPSYLLVFLVSLSVPLATVVAINSFNVLDSALIPLVLWFDLGLFGLALLDAFTTISRKGLVAEREAMRVVSIRKPHDVTITLTNRKWRSLSLRVVDDVPEEFIPEGGEFSIRLQAKKRAILGYRFRAENRGKFTMNSVHVRASSFLRLWRTYQRIPVVSEFHVYPDLQQLGQYALMARTNRLSLLGVRRTRRVGQDNEFERLRDYSQDDNYRHIDWRSTARRNRLTVRDFQTSQSQRIIFMLDCGRMMTNLAQGMSLLDHSLNAVLMMSYVALRQGDSVGLLCFSDRIHRYVPPRGSMGQMNHLLHAVFDRFPEMVESRYDKAFLHLASNCLKRSLVVLVTNVIDEVNSLQIEQYLGSMVGRHLPMGVLLRDHRLFDAADQPTDSVAGVYQSAAAAQILRWRHQVLVDLEHRGVLSLDVFPEDMTAPLINRYLDIKARHML